MLCLDIMGNAEFEPSKNIFMAVQADLKKKGLGSTDHIPPISRRDLTKIYNTAFDVDTAVGRALLKVGPARTRAGPAWTRNIISDQAVLWHIGSVHAYEIVTIY